MKKTKYVKGRNWQMFLRKRIRRMHDSGWRPEDIAFIYGISENVVVYHLQHS